MAAQKLFTVTFNGHKYFFNSDILPKNDAMKIVKATDVQGNMLELTFKDRVCTKVEIVK